MMLEAPRASESGHWYSRHGEPVYEVAGVKGPVTPDIRHARKLGLYPGVTTIIRQAAAPGLERWKIDQAILASLTLPRVEGESSEALLARIRADADEQARQARDKGTQIHAAIQGHYDGQPPAIEMLAYVQGVTECIEANCGGHKWVPERPCAHPLGFGTKSDLHAKGYCLDFKGSDFTDAAKLKTWDEHAMQLAATRKALGHEDADCAIVYVSRTVPGLCRLIWIDEEDLERGWEMFQGLHAYWCAKNNYYPARWEEKAAA